MMLFILCCLLFQQPRIKREYHSYKIEEITSENPKNWKRPLTHVSTDGYITYVNLREVDGDWHIRLCSSMKYTSMDVKHCIVAEVILSLDPAGIHVPKVGEHLAVAGIVRYDAENPGHHWWEIHPVEQMMELD